MGIWESKANLISHFYPFPCPLPTGTELHGVVVEVFGGVGNTALKYAKMQVCLTGISKNDVRITLVNVNLR